MSKIPILTVGDDGVFEPSNNAVAVACRAHAAVYVGAASAEHGARDRWVKAAKTAVKDGVTVAMLTKGTEETPNPQFDKEVVTVLRDCIIDGVSDSKKGMKFSSPLPSATGAEIVAGKMYSWTVTQLLALTPAQLRDIDDDVLKTQRRTYMQLVDGPMMSRLLGHIARIENPDAKRAAKKKAKARPAKDAPLMDRMVALLTEFNAQVLTLKDDSGKVLPGVVQAQEAGLELLARIGQMRK